MLLAKLALPLLLAASGIGAAAYATVGGDDAGTVTTGAPDAWIDAPLGDKVYAPGDIEVFAHATAHEELRALELEVDGEVVATDEELERVEKLYEGTFTWAAEVGTHQLKVRPVGGTGAASTIRIVEVGEGGAVATTTTTTAPDASTTTTSTSATTTTTTTTTTPGATTTAPPMATTTTRPPATTTPPTVPPTTAPPSPAAIDAASVYSPYGDDRLYVGACGYTMDVTATVRNAASVEVRVEGTRTSPDMDRSGSTYRFTLRSGMFAASDVGVHRVLIVATGGGRTTTASAGRVDIRLTCPKD